MRLLGYLYLQDTFTYHSISKPNFDVDCNIAVRIFSSLYYIWLHSFSS